MSEAPPDETELPRADTSPEVPAPDGNPALDPEDLSKDKLLAGAPRDETGRPSLGEIPLRRKLGQGGMGAVYSAMHPRLRIPVAVKVLPFHLADADPSLVQRFYQEAQATAQINSPNLVRVIDVNEDADIYYLVLEFVDGLSAEQYLREALRAGRAGLPCRDALHIVAGATRGLAEAHRSGIIHRDVKPDNILIPRRREGAGLDLPGAKLADLGLAKMEDSGRTLATQAGTAMGTPGFMAPEQCMDAKSAGPPADVFAMGATLYALLTGREPFAGESLGAVIMETLQQPHKPVSDFRADVPAPVLDLVERCLDKKPENRFADATGLLPALEDVLAHAGADFVGADTAPARVVAVGQADGGEPSTAQTLPMGHIAEKDRETLPTVPMDGAAGNAKPESDAVAETDEAKDRAQALKEVSAAAGPAREREDAMPVPLRKRHFFIAGGALLLLLGGALAYFFLTRSAIRAELQAIDEALLSRDFRGARILAESLLKEHPTLWEARMALQRVDEAEVGFLAGAAHEAFAANDLTAARLPLRQLEQRFPARPETADVRKAFDEAALQDEIRQAREALAAGEPGLALKRADALVAKAPARSETHALVRDVIEGEVAALVKAERFSEALARIDTRAKERTWLKTDGLVKSVYLAHADGFYQKGDPRSYNTAQLIYRKMLRAVKGDLEIRKLVVDRFGPAYKDGIRTVAMEAAFDIARATKGPLDDDVAKTLIHKLGSYSPKYDDMKETRDILRTRHPAAIERLRPNLETKETYLRLNSYLLIKAADKVSAKEEIRYQLKNFCTLTTGNRKELLEAAAFFDKSADRPGWTTVKAVAQLPKITSMRFMSSFSSYQKTASAAALKALLPEIKDTLIELANQSDDSYLRANAYNMLRTAGLGDTVDEWAFHARTLVTFDANYTTRAFKEAMAYFVARAGAAAGGSRRYRDRPSVSGSRGSGNRPRRHAGEGRKDDAVKALQAGLAYLDQCAERFKNLGMKGHAQSARENRKLMEAALQKIEVP